VREHEVPRIRQGDQLFRLQLLSPSNRAVHLPTGAANPPSVSTQPAAIAEHRMPPSTPRQSPRHAGGVASVLTAADRAKKLSYAFRRRDSTRSLSLRRPVGQVSSASRRRTSSEREPRTATHRG